MSKKMIFGTLRRQVGAIFRDLCCQAVIGLAEDYAMKERIHILLRIPPKFGVVHTVALLKGKSAILILREHLQVKGNFTGRHFWGRGYCVGTVGPD
ncbi:IS200/IS605 family transposase [Microbulbifer sp. TYP-18]|uniref:IS200/IS605 family transposase n=1 Tax=Microbulbifer sp. TYP-18 TaxID=3230024 RepID=UPI0034C62F90